MENVWSNLFLFIKELASERRSDLSKVTQLIKRLIWEHLVSKSSALFLTPRWLPWVLDHKFKEATMLLGGQTTLPSTRCPVKSHSTRRQRMNHRICAQALVGTPTWTTGSQHASFSFQNHSPQHFCHKYTKKGWSTWSCLSLKLLKQVETLVSSPSDRGRRESVTLCVDLNTDTCSQL